MNIQGFQKLTLLDFPGKVACTVFTGGCNFRCPFCHNASLVVDFNADPEFTEEYVLDVLKKRKGILDGVCITGGEPLLQPDIAEFIKKIKELGYPVKLDTNGSFPERLRELIELNLIDYVAMDIKTSFKNYSKLVGIDNYNTEKIEKSTEILMNSDIDYEFRTTLVKELHTTQDIVDIGEKLKGAKKFFLQGFIDSGNVIEDGFSAFERSEMLEMRDIMRKFIPNAEIRGL